MKKLVFLLFILGIVFSSCTKDYKQTENGIIFRKDNVDIKLTVCSEKIIRVEYDPVDSVPARNSLVVVNNWKPVKYKTATEGENIVIATSYLTIKLNKETGNITYEDNTGKVLLSETLRVLVADTVMGECAYNLSQSWKLSEDEGIYGLGQLQNGYMNLRGTTDTLVQTNTVAVNPFLISTQGYGILWDNYSKTIFKDDKNGASFWSEVGDKIDYYFIAGENMDDVISGYRQISGKAPMFGKWAFGY